MLWGIEGVVEGVGLDWLYRIKEKGKERKGK